MQLSCQKMVKAVQTKLKIIQSSTKISFETGQDKKSEKEIGITQK